MSISRNILFVVVAALSAHAGAQSILSDNFDSDSLGSLIGQAPWQGTGTDFNVVAGGGSIPTAYSGSQLLESNGSNGSDEVLDYIGPAWQARNAGNNTLEASARMYMISGDTTSRTVYMGLTSDSGQKLALVGFAYGTGQFFGFTTTTGMVFGPSLAQGEWHTVQFDAHLNTHTTDFYVDNTLFGSGTFTDSTVNSLYLKSTPIDSGTIPGAFFDNVTAQAVPEPSSFAAIGVGLVGLLWSRRRKA